MPRCSTLPVIGVEWLIRANFLKSDQLMGRKERREREAKRENYATKNLAAKRKQTLIAIGVLSVIAVIVGYSVWLFIAEPPVTPGGPPNAGTLGSDHSHAAILVRYLEIRLIFPVLLFRLNQTGLILKAETAPQYTNMRRG